MNVPNAEARGWSPSEAVPVLTADGLKQASGMVHRSRMLAVAYVESDEGGMCWSLTHMATGRWIACFAERKDAFKAGNILAKLGGWGTLEEARQHKQFIANVAERFEGTSAW